LAVGFVLPSMEPALSLSRKALPLVLGFALAAAGAGCAQAEMAQSADGQASRGWTSFRDSRTGLRGSFPSSWHRGPASLEPRIISPRQLFTVATFPPRREPPRSGCGYLRPQEIREVGSRGAFITLFVGGANPTLMSRTHMRPKRFRLKRSKGQVGPPNPRAYQERISFKSHGRYFTAGAVIGLHASREVRQDAMLILDRLRLGSLRLKS
jgi:hypothetical protein